jgi:hypothetical protein
LRADFSRRQKSAPLTNGNGCSFSPSTTRWPTPTTRDERSVYASPETHQKNARPLSETAGRWATPKASQAGPDFAKLARSSTGVALAAQANLWATPLASSGDKGGPAQAFGQGGGTPLAAQASRWATPTVADTEGGRANRSGDRSGELLIRGQALQLHSRQDPMTSPDGATPLRSGLILNPLFVETLMGWPPGLSGLAIGHHTPAPCAWTGCACSAVAWFRWRRLSRSALSRLSLPEPLPVQLDLFG